jgi:drug/metabolite transporter (DMT)-like permease
VGVFTQIGQVYLTRGLQLQPAGRALALSYLQVVFATLWGFLAFREMPDAWTIAGSLLILAGTALATLR